MCHATRRPRPRRATSLLRPVRAIGLAVLVALASPTGASARLPLAQEDQRAMRAVVRDLCHRDVAVLGEATHADGHTEAFKVALVERLVDRCGFRAVVFEGSLYEFVGFDRARRAGRATEEMVGNAIGGLWKFEAEFKPLTRFLFARAMAGRIALGGMDDQLGGFEQPFANEAMPALLTQDLPPARGAACREALRRRIFLDFDAAHPDSDAFRSLLRGCVADMRAAPGGHARTEGESSEHAALLDGIDRQLARDRLPATDRSRDRDRAMYGEFARFAAGLRKGMRVIVWTHSFHAAKSPAVRPDANGAPTFGTLLHRAYGGRAFALAFSARGGSYRWSRTENRPLPPPPPGALELAVPEGGKTVYLDGPALRARGVASAAPDSHVYRTARWSDMFDGLVVFATERPPRSERPFPAS